MHSLVSCVGGTYLHCLSPCNLLALQINVFLLRVGVRGVYQRIHRDEGRGRVQRARHKVKGCGEVNNSSTLPSVDAIKGRNHSQTSLVMCAWSSLCGCLSVHVCCVCACVRTFVLRLLSLLLQHQGGPVFHTG